MQAGGHSRHICGQHDEHRSGFRAAGLRVTGASAGIGAEFAARLGAQNHDLVLVARRRDRLDEIAAKLRDLHGIRVDVIDADLSVAGTVDAIAADVARLGITIDMLINNAGFGTHGRFETISPRARTR